MLLSALFQPERWSVLAVQLHAELSAVLVTVLAESAVPL